MRSLSLCRLSVVASALAIGSWFIQSQACAVFTDASTAVLGGANYSTRSASLADYDGDGDLDLMFQTSAGPKLYRNNLIGTGNGTTLTYSDVTSTMLPSGMNLGMWSAAWGDYNSDGKVDVFVGASSGTGTLLKNNSPSAFTNANTAAGLTGSPFTDGFTQNVGWGDFNNDHRLDFVVGMEGPAMHQMYTQGSNGKFTAVGAAVGLQVPFGTKSYGMAIGDYDGDGDLDVYISTCRAGGNIQNNLFKNQLKETGTLSFVDVASTAGVQNTNNTYGAQFIDLDNDGKLDLVVTGAQNDTTGVANPSKIFRNNGDGTFTDVDTIIGHAVLPNAGATDPNGLKLVDYDNDGKLDIYYHDNLSSGGNQRLLHNNGNWQFTDVTTAMGLSGVSVTGAGGYDSVWGDLNHDGSQDLIDVNNLTTSGVATPEKVYINDAQTNGNHWLYVTLKGPNWDSTGIGTSLYATMNLGTPDQVTLRRESNTDADTFNQSDLPVHFGMGAADHVDWLRVVWPDGTVQFLHDVTANQYMTLDYSTALQGDFNGDGKVDMGDYLTWRSYLGSVFTQDDYNTWRQYFGKTLTAGLGSGPSVPEPTAVILLGMCGCGMLTLRRR